MDVGTHGERRYKVLIKDGSEGWFFMTWDVASVAYDCEFRIVVEMSLKVNERKDLSVE